MFSNPYGLFVRNLTLCSGMEIEDIQSEFQETVIAETNHLCDECMADLQTGISEGQTCISGAFIDFLDEMARRKNAFDEKGHISFPDYCLFQFFLKISHIHVKIKQRIAEGHALNKDDCKKIAMFKQLFSYYNYEMDAVAISERSLKRMLIEKEAGVYSTVQARIIDYLLTRVFPRLVNNDKSFLALLKEDSLEEICYSDLATRTQVVDYTNAPSEIAQSFDELRKMQNHDYKAIGEQLSLIHKKLIQAYQRGKLLINIQQSTDDTTIAKENTAENYPSAMDAAILSSQILYFMRWIPIMDEADDCSIDTLRLVESLADRVKKSVDEKLKQSEDTDFLLSNQENIFIAIKALREDLIYEMYSQADIRSLFCSRYIL